MMMIKLNDDPSKTSSTFVLSNSQLTVEASAIVWYFLHEKIDFDHKFVTGGP
jgi:hypothetical protein